MKREREREREKPGNTKSCVPKIDQEFLHPSCLFKAVATDGQVGSTHTHTLHTVHTVHTHTHTHTHTEKRTGCGG